jgi:hypothetical protein
MSRIDALTDQFYAWEQRCRGWALYPYPVDLEPSFEPFFFHTVPNAQPVIDDGLRPTLLNRIIEEIKTTFHSEPGITQEAVEESPLNPYPFTEDVPLIALSISLPKEQKVHPDEMEHLLFILSQSQHPISFEVIGTHVSIRLHFVCRESDADHVYNQIKAYFPECGIQEVPINDIIPDNKSPT